MQVQYPRSYRVLTPASSQQSNPHYSHVTTHMVAFPGNVALLWALPTPHANLVFNLLDMLRIVPFGYE
jgi:hypothetical protein